MIPAAFDYHRPNDLNGVISLLQEHGDDARVIAGGHSLIPLMKLRMAEVPHLIDLQSISELTGIESGSIIRIGAMTTQADIIDNASLASSAPILRKLHCKLLIRRYVTWVLLAEMWQTVTREMICPD